MDVVHRTALQDIGAYARQRLKCDCLTILCSHCSLTVLCSTKRSSCVGPTVRGSLTDDQDALHSPMCTLDLEPGNISGNVHSMHLLSTEPL